MLTYFIIIKFGIDHKMGKGLIGIVQDHNRNTEIRRMRELQEQQIGQQQSEQQTRNCPSCRRSKPFDSILCPYCKKDFRQKKSTEEKTKFCAHCGKPI